MLQAKNKKEIKEKSKLFLLAKINDINRNKVQEKYNEKINIDLVIIIKFLRSINKNNLNKVNLLLEKCKVIL